MNNQGNGHGRRPPIPFGASMLATAPPNVPIVGQPFSVESWFVTVLAVCHCEAHQAFFLAGRMGATAECPKCHRRYQLVRVASRPDGQMEIGINLASAPPAETPPPDPPAGAEGA